MVGQLRQRVDELEVENRRLRSLLGMDDRAAEPAPRWVPTLVIVDRQHLVDQWRDQLGKHLGLTKKQVGQVAGPRKASGIVDIAMAQSLSPQRGRC